MNAKSMTTRELFVFASAEALWSSQDTDETTKPQEESKTDRRCESGVCSRSWRPKRTTIAA